MRAAGMVLHTVGQRKQQEAGCGREGRWELYMPRAVVASECGSATQPGRGGSRRLSGSLPRWLHLGGCGWLPEAAWLRPQRSCGCRRGRGGATACQVARSTFAPQQPEEVPASSLTVACPLCAGTALASPCGVWHTMSAAGIRLRPGRVCRPRCWAARATCHGNVPGPCRQHVSLLRACQPRGSCRRGSPQDVELVAGLGGGQVLLHSLAGGGVGGVGVQHVDALGEPAGGAGAGAGAARLGGQCCGGTKARR